MQKPKRLVSKITTLKARMKESLEAIRDQLENAPDKRGGLLLHDPDTDR